MKIAPRLQGCVNGNRLSSERDGQPESNSADRFAFSPMKFVKRFCQIVKRET